MQKRQKTATAVRIKHQHVFICCLQACWFYIQAMVRDRWQFYSLWQSACSYFKQVYNNELSLNHKYTNTQIAPHFIVKLRQYNTPILTISNFTMNLSFPSNLYNYSKTYSNMEADTQQILGAEKPRKKLECLIVSDTHGCFKPLHPAFTMKGDVFIHAGDFTDYGREKDFIAFFQYLDKLSTTNNFKDKIVIAGNHQISLDRIYVTPKKRQIYLKRYPCSLTRQHIVHQISKRAVYLEHQAIEIEGVKIFGSPYTPYCVGNAFQYRHWDQKMIWEAIPQDIDLLVTHGPPKGILDLNTQKQSCGSQLLLEKVLQVKPKYHVFGHIHESAGMYKKQGITFVNVAMSPTRIFV